MPDELFDRILPRASRGSAYTLTHRQKWAVLVKMITKFWQSGARFGLLALLLLPLSVEAGAGLDRLHAFTANLRSLSANFAQSLYDDQGETIQESRGTLLLQRPGRFRWDYTQPFQQLILADGKRLWIYDSELEQVTVKKLDQALGNAPIMLLSEDRPLEEDFSIRELGNRAGLEWLELEPRVKDTDFQKIFLGLDETGMKVMELRDNFGQATQIKFHEREINRKTDDKAFHFEPPPGVDVIGEQ